MTSSLVKEYNVQDKLTCESCTRQVGKRLVKVYKSVGYTGAPGFVLAAAWLALGLGLLLLLCCCCCCCRHRLKGSHHGGNLLPFLFLLLFTGAAVAGCVLVYIGQGKLHDELSQTLDYVVQESKGVVVRLRNTSAVLAEAQSIGVLQFALPDSRKVQIQQLDTQLISAANTLQNKTEDNAQNISDVLNRVRLAMIIVAGVMLLLILLGFLFSVLGITCLMYTLIVTVWIFIAATWLLCGVYIMLNNVIGDTCIAMEQWVANPSAQTSLQEILPCVDINTTDRALSQTRTLTNDTVNGINTVLSTVLNSGTTQGLPLMCNPLQPTLNAPGCVDISAASQEWQPYVCSNPAASQGCQLSGRLTPQLYDQLNRSVGVVDGLNDNIPFLLDLANCQFVRQVFTTIRQEHCPPLRKYIKWQYIGLALISGGFMFAIWLWIVFNRRRRHRFSHHVKDDQNPQFMARGSAPQQTPPKAAV
ncbi:hypothetical protein L7F22_039642 [Adiantum nelumboides]|nr:hypothetical protein [Adiantum nelumboides]